MLKPFLKKPVTIYHRRPTIYSGMVQAAIPFYPIPTNCCLAFSLSEVNTVTFQLTGTKGGAPASENIAFTGQLHLRGFQLFDTLTTIAATGTFGGDVDIVPLREDGSQIVDLTIQEEALADTGIEPHKIEIDVPGEGRFLKGFPFYFADSVTIAEGDKIKYLGVMYRVDDVILVEGLTGKPRHLEVSTRRKRYAADSGR
jgi:hypothetical protein